MTTPLHAGGSGPADPSPEGDPAAALADLDAVQRRAHASLRPNPLGLFLPWGLGYLIGFGAVRLAVGPDSLLPDLVAGIVVAVCAIGAIVGSTVTLARATRCVRGPSARIGAMYGWSWPLGFAVLALVLNRVEAAFALPGPAMSLLWSGGALLVVGLLYLAGGLLYPGSGQYWVGVWILVSAVLAVLVGYPSNFTVLALAGGGGFVVAGIVMHRRLRGNRR